MTALKRFWSSSPPEYKDYFFIYIWGIIWPVTYLFVTPSSALYLVNFVFVILWTTFTAAGGVIAVTGLVQRDNLLLERFGVTLLMTGPVAFAITQFGALVYKAVLHDPALGSPWNHVHLIFFALWPLLFFNKRRRQLKARVDVARQVPLGSEVGD